MRFRSQLLLIALKHKTAASHVFIALAVLIIPLSQMLKLAGPGESSNASLSEISATVPHALTPPAGTKSLQPARSSMTMTIDFDEDGFGGHPTVAFLQQEDQRILSEVLTGQMFAPSAFAISQRLSINDPVNVDADTYLHLACRTEDPFMVWLLIESGASSISENRYGETPMDVVGHEDTEVYARITRMISHQGQSAAIQTQGNQMFEWLEKPVAWTSACLDSMWRGIICLGCCP